MRTSNPALLPGTFQGYGYVSAGDAMTVQGVVAKTGILLAMVLLTAGWTWIKYYQSGANPQAVSVPMMIGLLGGFVLAMATVFKKEWAPITAILYALLEGLFLGGLSAMFETSFPGIIIQTTALTFGTLFAMLALYRSGVIKVTENFKLGVMAATGGIALFYLVTMILSFFGISVPFVYGGGAMGIAFSIFVVGIAALNLVLDFNLIEEGANRNLPKYMEWYCSFALMVTLIWLYIEFLRLLSKVRER